MGEDNTIDLVLPMLSQINGKLNKMDEKLDRVVDDMQNIKVRTTHVEEGLAGVNRRLDSLDFRFERIEKRLDITESAMYEKGEKFEGQHD